MRCRVADLKVWVPARLEFILCVLCLLAPEVLHGEMPTSVPQSTSDVEGIQIEPAKIVLQGANRHQQLLLTALTRSGPVDLTHQAEVTAGNPALVRIEGATVFGASDGQTELTINWSGQVARVPVEVAGFAEYPPVHFVNDVVPLFSKLGCNSGGCHGRAAGQN